MSQQRDYPGGHQRDYGDNYDQGGQGGQGRRQKWNQSQGQNYGQQDSGPYYSDDQYASQPPERQDQQAYQYPTGDQYNDPYYYQGQDESYQSSHGHYGYDDDQSYYQDSRQYQQQDYYRAEKQQSYKQQQHQQKPYKKVAYPKKGKYPEEQGSYGGKESYNYSQQSQRPSSMQEGLSGSQQGHSQGTSQKGKASEDKTHNKSSKRKGSELQEHQPQSGGKGATKHAFGEYYSQKRYMQEQEIRGKQQARSEADGEQLGVAAGKDQPVSAGKVHLAAKPAKTRETISSGVTQTQIEDEKFSKTMAKLNTLDRGTYFVREDKKCAHFMVNGRSDLLGWKDTYVINGYLLHGVIIKLMTLTSRIYLFVENLHSIYKKYIKIDDDGETARWTDAIPDVLQIVTVNSIEKVEVLDNDEEGFEGFVCYTICEDSTLEFSSSQTCIDDWKYVQELILLYEPTSIRKIYLDVVYNSIYKPESKGFGGKRIAAIVNPHVPGETIQYSNTIVTALDKQCVVGTIWIQNGRYTLIAETSEDMERLIKLIDTALEIAEELNAYVMITNLRRTFDFIGKTILYINSDPTLKLIRSSNPISFANKIKKSENLLN